MSLKLFIQNHVIWVKPPSDQFPECDQNGWRYQLLDLLSGCNGSLQVKSLWLSQRTLAKLVSSIWFFGWPLGDDYLLGLKIWMDLTWILTQACNFHLGKLKRCSEYVSIVIVSVNCRLWQGFLIHSSWTKDIICCGWKLLNIQLQVALKS